MPTARINITVTSFHDINTTTAVPRWCVANNPVLVDDANGKVSIRSTDPATIVVNSPASLDLEFTILPANTFVPAGIAYQQTNLTSDPMGRQNFNLGSLTASTITIEDKSVHRGQGANAPRWKFYLLIQDASGALGIIDPGIQNEN